eukprot:scaffold210619_cov28-Tisochrysis_lutea.AAC.6
MSPASVWAVVLNGAVKEDAGILVRRSAAAARRTGAWSTAHTRSSSGAVLSVEIARSIPSLPHPASPVRLELCWKRTAVQASTLACRGTSDSSACSCSDRRRRAALSCSAKHAPVSLRDPTPLVAPVGLVIAAVRASIAASTARPPSQSSFMDKPLEHFHIADLAEEAKGSLSPPACAPEQIAEAANPNAPASEVRTLGWRSATSRVFEQWKSSAESGMSDGRSSIPSPSTKDRRSADLGQEQYDDLTGAAAYRAESEAGTSCSRWAAGSFFMWCEVAGEAEGVELLNVADHDMSSDVRYAPPHSEQQCATASFHSNTSWGRSVHGSFHPQCCGGLEHPHVPFHATKGFAHQERSNETGEIVYPWHDPRSSTLAAIQDWRA